MKCRKPQDLGAWVDGGWGLEAGLSLSTISLDSSVITVLVSRQLVQDLCPPRAWIVLFIPRLSPFLMLGVCWALVQEGERDDGPASAARPRVESGFLLTPMHE
jgi:hypothetical protein